MKLLIFTFSPTQLPRFLAYVPTQTSRQSEREKMESFMYVGDTNYMDAQYGSLFVTNSEFVFIDDLETLGCVHIRTNRDNRKPPKTSL